MHRLAHEFKAEIDPELNEIEDTRALLTSLILSGVKDSAELRRKHRGRVKNTIYGPLVSVRSAEVYYHEGELEPGQEVAAWLSSDDVEIQGDLYTQIVDEYHNHIATPKLWVTATRPDKLNFTIDERRFTPADQLNLLTGSIATVRLISLQVHMEL